MRGWRTVHPAFRRAYLLRGAVVWVGLRAAIAHDLGTAEAAAGHHQFRREYLGPGWAGVGG